MMNIADSVIAFRKKQLKSFIDRLFRIPPVLLLLTGIQPVYPEPFHNDHSGKLRTAAYISTAVANYYLTIYDAETFEHIKTLGGSSAIQGMAVDRQANLLYGANEMNQSLMIINTLNNTVVKQPKDISISETPIYVTKVPGIDIVFGVNFGFPPFLMNTTSLSFNRVDADIRAFQLTSTPVRSVSIKPYVYMVTGTVDAELQNGEWGPDQVLQGSPKPDAMEQTSYGNLYVYSALTGKRAGVVPVGKNLVNLAIDSKGRYLYINDGGHSGQTAVLVVDAQNFQLIKKIPLAHKPFGIAVNPVENYAYVTTYDPEKKLSWLTAINTKTFEVIDTGLEFKDFAGNLAVDPKGERIWVLFPNADNTIFSAIDYSTISTVGSYGSSYIIFTDTLAP